MMLFDKLIVFVFAVVVAAVPFEVDDRFGHIAERATYYSSSWNDGKGKVVYKNGPEGQYSVTWSGNKGNFVVGKGWNPGGSRIVAFNGTFAPNGNAYLCVYGWTTSPLVEYYIIENYGSHAPWDNPEQKSKGNVTVDGSTYTLWTKMRINKPSIQGTATFPQFWSVRDADDLRSGGSVDTGAHFKAWADNGLKLGRQNYMIVAVEGQDSNGTASVNVGVAP
ncbi:glycoside hydrolase [Amylocarpus encephaloides]|uniref:Endo-1,4-beta-xylanase n=1 Tax=Amylocarpus encephaloides TaxID=45428 RepID=A0A9P8C3Y0_9HELO|nr:glycoside hydrolase [Amylocarpus encephaloides]